MLSGDQTVAKTVLEHSGCAEVFRRHRIDFCCRGEVSIEEAARQRGLDVTTLLAELDRVVARGEKRRGPDPRDLPTPALVEHIVSEHHAYLRRALPLVQALGNKVARVHGRQNPKLRELDGVIAELIDTLALHIEDEERHLFPVLLKERHDSRVVSDLFDAMIAEHTGVALLLERVRSASEDFALPKWACMSYRTLFTELENLESDLFTHIHLENHLLRSRFVASAI